VDVADVRLTARGEIHLIGKGEKSRIVPVHPKLPQALAAWFAKRPSRPGADSAALFTSIRGTRMTTDVIDVITGLTGAASLERWRRRQSRTRRTPAGRARTRVQARPGDLAARGNLAVACEAAGTGPFPLYARLVTCANT
jgi:integrase